MTRAEKAEKAANEAIANALSESALEQCKEYELKACQRCVAHIKIVKDEKISAMFDGLKESYGVYFNDEYVGSIERPRGNQMWNAYQKGQRHTGNKRTSKTPAGAAWTLVEDRFSECLIVKEEIVQ